MDFLSLRVKFFYELRPSLGFKAIVRGWVCACVCVCVWAGGGGCDRLCGKRDEAKVPSLKIRHLIDCSVASRVVVMVQWLAHPTSIQGDAGTIPTHGTHVFFIQRKEQLVVRCRYF